MTSDEGSPPGRRGLWFLAFSATCLVAAGAYVALRIGDGKGAATSGKAPDTQPSAEQVAATLADIHSRPHVYYRSTRGSEFGRLVVAAIDAPDDRREVTGLVCDRLAFAGDRGVCLVDNRGTLGPSTLAHVFDRDFQTLQTLPLPGFPSRTRISSDGRFAATTVFVTGETYTANFATRTNIIDLPAGRIVAELEEFVVTRDGQPFRKVDFNFWGVTFRRDSNRFFATLGTGGHRYLVEGDIAGRTVRVMRDGVECPSLSPDERHLAFKSRNGNDEWRLHVLDLGTMNEWSIAGETRSIDDQVEWLDDEQVLYGILGERGLPEQAVNVWVSPIRMGDGTPPRVFAHAAWSPSVVRP